ncbi:MAG: hypothetical protein KF832_09240 [Caldilineaceae bacterium]|nr:hypothetical protein [Caldilineaceae bacterium]
MKYQLDDSEQEILDAFEHNELQPTPDAAKQIETAKIAARNTTLKTHRVNLRLTERDFYLAHVKANEEGLPYQTLLASIIHKYLTGRLVERSS